MKLEHISSQICYTAIGIILVNIGLGVDFPEGAIIITIGMGYILIPYLINQIREAKQQNKNDLFT